MIVLAFFSARQTSWPLDWNGIGTSLFGEFRLPAFLTGGGLAWLWPVAAILVLVLDSSRGARRHNGPRVYWGFIPEGGRQLVKNAVVVGFILTFIVLALTRSAASAHAAQLGLDGSTATFPLRNLLCAIGVMSGLAMLWVNRTGKWRANSMTVTASRTGQYQQNRSQNRPPQGGPPRQQAQPPRPPAAPPRQTSPPRSGGFGGNSGGGRQGGGGGRPSGGSGRR